MKIKTSISEIELLRCDFSKSFYDYSDNFYDTYDFDSLNKENLSDIIESKIEWCKQYKGLDKWYTDIFSAFYSYIPEEIINNSKNIVLLKNKKNDGTRNI